MNLLHTKPSPVTHEGKVLQALKAAGKQGCYGRELCHPGVGTWRFSAYIHDLRKDGHKISTVRIGKNEFKYCLNEEKN